MRAAAAGAAVIASLSTPALAETLRTALTQAYQNNPQLNAQRAALRGERILLHKLRADFSQRPLVILRVAIVKLAGQGQLEHGVGRS